MTGQASAHRRDEYLQAARLAIDPGRVQIELDLTPGIAVAEQVLADIDRDGDKTIAPAEGRLYARRMLGAIALDVDGTPLSVELIDTVVPTVEAIMKGEGAMRITAVAVLPVISNGAHQLRYRNAHRPDIGVYLANALVPASDRVIIAAQRRDIAQRDLTIDYELRADRAARIRGGISVAVAGAVIFCTALWWRRRAPTRPGFR